MAEKMRPYFINFCLYCPFLRGSEFSSYKIELRNQVMQNDVILRVNNSKMFLEIFFELLTGLCELINFNSIY